MAITQTFNYTGHIEIYTVPEGVYALTIKAVGACGGSNSYDVDMPTGRGASMQGLFTVTPGEQLSILVGGRGSHSWRRQYNVKAAGGGGGSFVWRGVGNASTSNMLIAAGGGGGNGQLSTTKLHGVNAVTTEAGTDGDWGGAGGSNGNGGIGGGSFDINFPGGGAGAGISSSGGGSGDTGGKAISMGGAGGIYGGGYGGGGAGGYGGGGSDFGDVGGGGGGGYSGGGGGIGVNEYDLVYSDTLYHCNGGGGGSFNGGTNQLNEEGVGIGHGQVSITDSRLTVDFTFSQNPGLSGQSITLDGSLSNTDPSCSIVSYAWDFGDGSSLSSSSPLTSKVYSNAGTYNVTLIVTDSCGKQDQITKTITINTGLIVDFTFPQNPSFSGQPITFDASASSTNPGCSIVSYTWDFGGGTSPLAYKVYPNAGNYNVTLTVTDSSGKQNQITKTINIVNAPTRGILFW